MDFHLINDVLSYIFKDYNLKFENFDILNHYLRFYIKCTTENINLNKDFNEIDDIK